MIALARKDKKNSQEDKRDWLIFICNNIYKLHLHDAHDLVVHC